MSQRPATIDDFITVLKRNLPIAILYIVIFITLPLFAYIDATELFPYLSLIYQVFGIRLLFVDEKHKMSRKSIKYSKLNALAWSILKSPQKSFDALKWIYKYKTKPPTKNCDIKLDISVTKIDHDYEKYPTKKKRIKLELFRLKVT